MLNTIIYHFIHNVKYPPWFIRGKPYPCYYDEIHKKIFYCTCTLKCQYRDKPIPKKDNSK